MTVTKLAILGDYKHHSFAAPSKMTNISFFKVHLIVLLQGYAKDQMIIIVIEDIICYDLINKRVADGEAFDLIDFTFSTGKQGYLASRRAPLILLMISILNSVGKTCSPRKIFA